MDIRKRLALHILRLTRANGTYNFVIFCHHAPNPSERSPLVHGLNKTSILKLLQGLSRPEIQLGLGIHVSIWDYDKRCDCSYLF